VDTTFSTQNSGYNVLYTKYSYATNSFSAETTLQASTTIYSAPVISINPSTNDLYVFWAGYPTASHIYYRKYTTSTSTWETAVDWIDESAEALTANDRLTCFYQAYSSKIGLLYMTKTASPYNVKFAFLSFNNPPNAPTLNSPVASYRFNPGASVTFSWTFSDNDTGDSQSAFQLQIGNSNFTVFYLDTGKVTSTNTNTTRTLPSNMTIGIYYWRVKTWDSQNAEGTWSTGRAIIVDGLKVSQYVVNLVNQKIYAKAVYAYDGQPIANGTVSYAGLSVSTNSTGWAVFDVSQLANVAWNSESYVVSEPSFGVTYKAQNQTIPFHKVAVYPFSLRGGNQITNYTWNDVEKKLSFATKGTCIVHVGDYGQPLRVEVDGAVYTNWTYNSICQEVTVNNLRSSVALIWKTEEASRVPGETMPPKETPNTPPIYVPSTPFVNVGLLIIVVAVIAAYSYSYRQNKRRKYLNQLWREKRKQTNKFVRWKKRRRFRYLT
jgi:hypothetical protein